VKIPADLKYTKEHEWVDVDGNIATVGITDYAQGELGDVVFVELPAIGAKIRFGDSFGTIEAVKAVSEIFSPVSGKIVEINGLLENDPMIVNSDPYGDGWMIKVDMTEPSELDQLLSSDDYLRLIG
jgi:glycine cleavage system H protein